MMKKFLVLLSLVLFVCAAPVAHAAMITTWEVGVFAEFDADSVVWTNGPDANTSAGAFNLRWGLPSLTNPNGQSGLDIINSAPTLVDTNGAAVENLKITDLNRPIMATSSFLDRVTLNSTLTLTPVVPPGFGLPPATLAFQIDYLETPNAADPCADGGANGVGINANGCADIFAIDQTALNFSFVYGDYLYHISFFENTGLTPLSDDACEAVLGAAACADHAVIGFETKEGEDTTAVWAAQISAQPIPEPSTLLLLGVGIAGLGFMRRKQAK